jgi:hypothetical protein
VREHRDGHRHFDLIGLLRRGAEVVVVIFPVEAGLPNLFGVIGANMGRKLFVALRLEVAHHFIEGCAGGHIKRIESPATLGAAKTPKTLLLNPYQLPAHGRRCRCAPTSTRLLSRDETCQFGISDSFGSGVLPDCSRKPSPSLGVADDS